MMVEKTTHAPAFRGPVILAMASLAVFLSGPGQAHGVSTFIDPILAEFGISELDKAVFKLRRTGAKESLVGMNKAGTTIVDKFATNDDVDALDLASTH